MMCWQRCAPALQYPRSHPKQQPQNPSPGLHPQPPAHKSAQKERHPTIKGTSNTPQAVGLQVTAIAPTAAAALRVHHHVRHPPTCTLMLPSSVYSSSLMRVAPKRSTCPYTAPISL